MFELAAYKIYRKERRHWLTIWPFTAIRLQELVRSSRITQGKTLYACVQHESWKETRHLPTSREIGAKPIAHGAIGLLSTQSRIWYGTHLGSVVDLQLYVPDKQVKTQETHLIQKAYMSGALEDIMDRWGGHAFSLHDSTRFNLDYCPDSMEMRRIFPALLPIADLSCTPSHVAYANIIWNMLYDLSPKRCAVIAGGYDADLMYQEVDESILRYEQTARLFPENKWSHLKRLRSVVH